MKRTAKVLTTIQSKALDSDFSIQTVSIPFLDTVLLLKKKILSLNHSCGFNGFTDNSKKKMYMFRPQDLSRMAHRDYVSKI